MSMLPISIQERAVCTGDWTDAEKKTVSLKLMFRDLFRDLAALAERA